MAIDFPSSPSNGATYTYNGVTYVYNSTTDQWIVQGTGSSELYVLKTGDTMTGSLTSVGYSGTTGTFTGDLSADKGTFGLTEITDDTQIDFHQGNFGANADSNRVTFTRDQANMSGTVPYGALVGRVNDGGTLTDACSFKMQRDDGAGFSTGGCFKFETNNGNGGNSEKMRLRENGNLQIGGTLPGDPNITLNSDGTVDFYNRNTGNDFMFRMFSNVGGTKVEKFKFETGGNAYKPSGGSWASLSDARSKTVLSSYASGLAELKQVEPVRYKYNGLEQEYVGIVAQQVETVMPELVSVSSGKTYDGEEFSDLRSVDQTPLTFALINAVKEMAVRIEALEAQLSQLTTTGGASS